MTTSRALILVFLLTILAYSNTLNGEFQFDDDLSVKENPYVTGSSRLSWDNISQNAVSGVRPFTSITFALNYRLGGFDVRWYHLTNIVIHLLNGLLLFVLVLQTFRSPKLPSFYSDAAETAAFFSSAIFLLHPIQTQAVSYISQRSELLVSLFFLCALLAYIKAVNSENKINSFLLYSAAAFCLLFAIGSKEIAVTIPVVMLMYDLCFLRDRPLLKRIAFPCMLLLLSLIAGFYVLANMSGPNAGFSTTAFTPLQYLMTQFRVIVTYLRLLILPVDQNLDYHFRTSRSLFEPDTALSLLFILGLLTFAAVSFKKWRIGSFFILWFFIILAPTSSIVPVIDPIYEHRVYLASAGLFIVFAGLLSVHLSPLFTGQAGSFSRGEGCNLFPPLRGGDEGEGDVCGITNDRISKRESSRYRKPAVITIVLLLLLLSVLTFQRNKVWQTKLALWEDVVKKSPMKSRPHNNLGNCYMLLGDHLRAVEEYKKAITLDKDNIEAYYNLGMNLEKTGRSGEAVFYYDIFVRNAPAVYAEQRQAVLEHIKEIRQDK